MTRAAPAIRALALAACLALCGGAQAVPRVAMVLPRAMRNTEAAFQNQLRNRGVQVDYSYVTYSGEAKDAATLVQRLRTLKPDLIYTWGDATTLAVAGEADTRRPQAFIRDIPIVFAEVADPVASGLVTNAARPGRNLSGVSHVAPLAAQMRALRAYSEIRKLGYVVDPRDPLSRAVRARLARLASQSGFELVDEAVPFDVHGRPDVPRLRATIAAIAARGADFLYIGPGALLSFSLRDAVTSAALEAKLPTFCATGNAAGTPLRCLFGLHPDSASAGRLAAYKAAQILVEHAAVESLPIEALARFTLFVNMPVALALRKYPPLELLDAAELVGVDVEAGRDPGDAAK